MQGANINAADKHHRSPLLLAASRGGWKAVETLMRLDADITLKDACDRNVLHFIVMNGGRLEHFAPELSKVTTSDRDLRILISFTLKNSPNSQLFFFSFFVHLLKSLDSLSVLLDHKDFCGCTPMHYASRNGHCKSIENLIRLGARINLKNNENQSPLHFAARLQVHLLNYPHTFAENNEYPFFADTDDIILP